MKEKEMIFGIRAVIEAIEAGKEIDTIQRIPAYTFVKTFDPDENLVLDIRRETEFDEGHVENAINKPLAEINEWIRDINPSKHFFVHCASGYRSMIAASILQARGYRNFSEIQGGYGAMLKANVPTQINEKKEIHH